MPTNWDYFRLILAIRKAGSLSGAAGQLKVSQQTAGRHLAALETELGVELVSRRTARSSGLELNEVGLAAAELADTFERGIGDLVSRQYASVTTAAAQHAAAKTELDGLDVQTLDCSSQILAVGHPDDDVEESKHEWRVLDQEDALKLLATCATESPIDMRDRSIIVMGLETGMRRVSLIGINIETTKIGRDGYPVAPVPIKGGGEKLFPVPLSDTVMIAIAPWRQWLRDRKVTKGPLFRSLMLKNGRGKLKHTVGENPLSESALYKIITQRAKQAGLEHVHLNIFRDTFIAWRMQGGMQPHQIAAITGQPIAGIAGMGALSRYIDVSRVGQEARQSTPPWLSKLVGRRP
ncbi:MAG: LysR family transcriptional regulator [Proteobacteria bacterium]|nr:LysR family transcriptional regulator [Pseudomonadota bacterium]